MDARALTSAAQRFLANPREGNTAFMAVAVILAGVPTHFFGAFALFLCSYAGFATSVGR